MVEAHRAWASFVALACVLAQLQSAHAHKPDKAYAENSETSETCPTGFVFLECGTACPVTCSNYGDVADICIKMCISGCFCPPGMIHDEAASTCVEDVSLCSTTSESVLVQDYVDRDTSEEDTSSHRRLVVPSSVFYSLLSLGIMALSCLTVYAFYRCRTRSYEVARVEEANAEEQDEGSSRISIVEGRRANKSVAPETPEASVIESPESDTGDVAVAAKVLTLV
mmetsp:Transcript_6147/g.10645  ORF Transcript_6147/g.10645 Transcript_6147/m.10645 type:complete len:225 (-) Transcript_6147:49-723(-)|eukprot:CAMPEP_0171498028 /NCGR_PEP_ID=MMETSP0958-20121227/7614_1 /TAXON_ID=87120 /ORGANISM="Aurantiochytrium limacinum, Strain ATCCMYA-1381" /LENGTH=224 /DNA_ID=CAMNT_0012032365 /DNA_START=26 /DNA_END=700 /DNA_ORIENTATION=-